MLIGWNFVLWRARKRTSRQVTCPEAIMEVNRRDEEIGGRALGFVFRGWCIRRQVCGINIAILCWHADSNLLR